MDGTEEDQPNHFQYVHLEHHHNHNHRTPHPLAGAEAYHRFLWHNKHVLFELKLSVIVILGGIIVLACVVYIVMQCRARIRPPGQNKNRRDDEKELFGSTETLENLLPAENSIRLKVRREQEFFV
ncbi:hypothetical protein BaRGS_00012456 [Batillaria attramentaria]|uniref:Uncharacterized protein n=1 Tax=Batillaria attramentaria TaxID=370345 RepID=A0ABD0LAI2_9CAEN|nr:hypothetical protein BaRGS_025738 [Batillaria attramentaria]